MFSNENWDIFKEDVLKCGNIIWGRKTYEAVLSWGEEYLKDFNDIKIIVISNSKIESEGNVLYCNSPKSALEMLKSYGIEKALVCGGTSIYSMFLKENLIDELIINYNTIAISNGKKMFNESIDMVDFKPDKVEIKSGDIIQIIMLNIK